MTMMEKPLVSVLMTAYNREKYIAEAMQSVLASTYQNLELLIVDDGSKDRTLEIVRDISAKDPRVQLHRNEKNLGDYPNRNRAASLAKGKYLKYVDSDDAIYPWAIEWMVNMMEANPEAGWGLCSMEQNIRQIFPLLLSPKEAYEYHYLGKGLFRRAPLSSIIKRSVFEEVGGFKPIRMAGDNEMWHRLAAHYPVLLMPQGMVWYRSHEGQEVTDFRDYINVYEAIKIKYLSASDCPLDPSTSSFLLAREKKKIKRNILRNVLGFDFETLKINLRNLGYHNGKPLPL